jgi:hypothetical protein
MSRFDRWFRRPTGPGSTGPETGASGRDPQPVPPPDDETEAITADGDPILRADPEAAQELLLRAAHEGRLGYVLHFAERLGDEKATTELRQRAFQRKGYLGDWKGGLDYAKTGPDLDHLIIGCIDGGHYQVARWLIDRSRDKGITLDALEMLLQDRQGRSGTERSR